ncbi:MAG: hypothetical protein RIS44_2562 [Pseudomonadota bacterium]|jgi:hypothetical protein
MIETLSASFSAGETKTFTVSGEYFELTDAPSSGVNVVLSDRSGAQVSSIRNSGPGIYVKPGRYEVIQITSTLAQDVGWIIADGDAGTRRLAGAVSIVDNVTLIGASTTVTNVSGSLMAANPSRKYLLIQNKDPVGRIWINFGAAASQATGVLIVPGGAFELDAKITGQEIFAIGDLASNTNIMRLQG